MALISTLVDDFNDSVVDPAKWPNSFGTYSETGGRARVACDAGFNAYSSALTYTLAGSAIYLRGYPPAAGGATTEAWAQILAKSSTGGTDLGFELRALTGELVMFSRTGYFDAAAVTIPYSATDHAWVRIRETGGTVYWDTSPDAAAWTNRRTLASPAWVADTDIEFQLIAHRSDGTPDFAEFDNVNITGTLAALGTSTETGTAQTLVVQKTKALAPGLEAEQALTLSPHKTRPLTPAVEVETSVAPGGHKTGAITSASETGTAVTIAAHMGRDDIDVTIGQPYSPWTVGEPHGASWPVGQPH